jgi:UDP-3-O-[3-hydroxymyristoyl] N-acetylglucosamine deacetylase
MLQQRTLKSLTRAVGVGLHGGQRVELTLRPAQPDTGIVFRRIDLPQPVDIPVTAAAVTDTRLASTLSAGGDPWRPGVNTVEHLMSACAGMGIDNLYVDITAEEVPILDGSAASFVYLLQSAASSCRARPSASSASSSRWKCARAKAAHSSGRGSIPSTATSSPSRSTSTTRRQPDRPARRVRFRLRAATRSDIARARTFGFTKDVEMMRSRGLSLGGSMDNAIVVDDYRVLNAEGLRYDDEFVKHKILDAIGDLYVIGKPLLAAYSAFKSGHALNNKLLRACWPMPAATR